MFINDQTAANGAANSARPLFDADKFASEMFLSHFQADVEDIIWAIKDVLTKQFAITCEEYPFCFGDFSDDTNDRWAWTIIDLTIAQDREASFVVSAREQDGVALYSFEGDNGSLQDVKLKQDAATILEFLLREVLP